MKFKEKEKVSDSLCFGEVSENPEKETCVFCKQPIKKGELTYEIGDPQYLHERCEKEFTEKIHSYLEVILEKKLSFQSPEVNKIALKLFERDSALPAFRFLVEKYYPGFRAQIKTHFFGK